MFPGFVYILVDLLLLQWNIQLVRLVLSMQSGSKALVSVRVSFILFVRAPTQKPLVK